MNIPVELGTMKTQIKVSIVDTHIPLLLCIDGLMKLGLSIDIHNMTATTYRTGETFKVQRTSNGHLPLPFLDMQPQDPEKKSLEESLLVEEDIFAMEDCDMEEKVSKLQSQVETLTLVY